MREGEKKGMKVGEEEKGSERGREERKRGEEGGRVFKATHNYSPRRGEEMSLMRGDLLTEGRKEQEGWASGRNFRGFVGLFPLHCVEEVTTLRDYRLPVDALLSEIGQMGIRKAPQPDCIRQASLSESRMDKRNGKKKDVGHRKESEDEGDEKKREEKDEDINDEKEHEENEKGEEKKKKEEEEEEEENKKGRGGAQRQGGRQGFLSKVKTQRFNIFLSKNSSTQISCYSSPLSQNSKQASIQIPMELPRRAPLGASKEDSKDVSKDTSIIMLKPIPVAAPVAATVAVPVAPPLTAPACKEDVELGPYYSKASSECKQHCTCGFWSSQSGRRSSQSGRKSSQSGKRSVVRRASSAQLYENARAHQNSVFLNSNNSNNNSTHNSNNNSSALLFTKLNTPSRRQFQILNRTSHPHRTYSVALNNELPNHNSYHTTPHHTSLHHTSPHHASLHHTSPQHTSSHHTSPLQPTFYITAPSYRTTSHVTLARFLVSCFTVLLVGLLSLLLISLLASPPFLYSLIASLSIALVLFFLLLFSRLCRCVLALAIPSISTDAGHVSKVLLLGLLLCWGPVADIENNITSAVGSYACLLEQVNNQTSLLMRPYDALMRQLNHTLHHVEEASLLVDQALLPLQRSLSLVDHRLQVGRSSLLATQETCLSQLRRAKGACREGLGRAREQCREVMGEIGLVYREAKQALDRINPNKWGVKNKRQLSREAAFMRRNQDICEPLNEQTACKSLEEGDRWCESSQWAGHAIQKALNNTQASLNVLYSHFRFHTSAAPYVTAREISQQAAESFRRTVLQEHHYRHALFERVVLLTQQLCVLLLLVPLVAAYMYVREYVSDETYDNHYGEEQLKTVDDFKNSVYKSARLLPLRRHEKLYIREASFASRTVARGRFVGLSLFGACALVLLGLHFVNFRMQGMLQSVLREQQATGDLNGWRSLELVVEGEGLFVDILNTFLANLHPSGRFFGVATDHTACLPPSIHFSFIHFIVSIGFMFIFLSCVLLKPQLLRLRSSITGFFFQQEQQGRLVWLHEHMSHRRSLFPNVLYAIVRQRARRRHLRRNVSCLHHCLGKSVKRCPRRCLLCFSTGSNFSTQRCEMADCFGLYCSTCFNDLKQLCPICHIATTSFIV